jgi:hypothetical protein
MAAPTISLSTTGTDPKLTTKQILESAVNGGLQTLWDAAVVASMGDAEADALRIDLENFRQDAADAVTAAEIATTGANYYDTISLGRAAVANGETFGVIANGSDLLERPTLFRRDSVSTQTNIADLVVGSELDSKLETATFTQTIAATQTWYVGFKEVVEGAIDGDGLALSARYLDGSQEDWFAPILYDDALWYAGYEQVSVGFSDEDGGIVSAMLLGGLSFEAFKLSADPYNAADTVVFVGDSLTQRGYPAAYQTLSERTAVNLGVGAQRSNQIAARIGAIAVPMTVSGGSIVAGANTVTHMNNLALTGGSGPNISYNQFLSRGDDNTSRSCAGTWGSVHGTLVRTATGGPPSTTETYTFTPDAGQTLPAKCPPGTPFVVDYDYENYTHVIWIGRNNYDDFSTIMDNVESCVRRIGHGRYVVMSVINSTDVVPEQENQAGWTAIFAIENALAVKYPGNFLNIRRLLIDRGLAVAGLSATGADTADIALDTIPIQLRADPIHLTTAGDAVVASLVNEFITAKGF